MKFLLLFLLLIILILWIERLYWKKRAVLLEMRLHGEDTGRVIRTPFDAWLDSRIERRWRKASRRQ